MTTDDIQADWRYDFNLRRAPDFPVDSRSPFAVGAVGRAANR
jgi:hypothetical protein